GGTALFAMAIGMSVPLLLIGLSAGSLLPRAGAWMIAVKRFFGVLLIGVAVWMVSPAIPEWAQMMAWAALLIVTAAFLRVFDPLPDGAAASLRFGKGLGALMLILGILQLVGVASGGRDVLQPLGALAARSAVAARACAAPPPARGAGGWGGGRGGGGAGRRRRPARGGSAGGRRAGAAAGGSRAGPRRRARRRRSPSPPTSTSTARSHGPHG